jgi:hypothetical protein
MALKLRRGPNSDRLSFTPAQGELIYTTDTKLVYIGDGITVGGVGVGGGGSGGGITTVIQDPAPQLGGNLDLNTHSITGTGSINITGGITGTGSINITGGIASTTNGGGLTLNNISTSSALSISAFGVINNTNSSGNNITLQNTAIKLKTDIANQDQGIEIFGNANSSGLTTGIISYYISRGTTESPTISGTGDNLSAFTTNGHNGTTYVTSSIILTSIDGTPVAGNSSVPTIMRFSVADGVNAMNPFDTTKVAYLNNKGVFYAPIHQAGSFTDTTMNAIPSPAAGMIVFNTTHNHFYGYNGTSWVAFTGP